MESEEKLREKKRDDEVIVNEEGKVVSSEGRIRVKLTLFSLMQLLDLSCKKSSKMKSRKYTGK